MIKKIDNLGRVVVPKGFRQMLGIRAGDPLDVEVDAGVITISPHQEGCIFCGEADVALTFMKKRICPDCLSRIKAAPSV